MSTTTILKILVIIIAYFAPIATMIHCVLIFIAIDFLTGVYASRKLGQKIVSHRLRNTIEKFVFYTSAIILGHMFMKEMANWTNLDQLIAGFIAMTELISIFENITRITGLNFMKFFRDTIISKFKNYGKQNRSKKNRS